MIKRILCFLGFHKVIQTIEPYKQKDKIHVYFRCVRCNKRFNEEIL